MRIPHGLRAALAGQVSVGATDPDFSNVSLLLHGDGTNGSTTFVDSSSNNFTITPAGNAQISTAQSKFGGASMYFDGNGDYLSISSSNNLILGVGDFTIETWARLAAASVQHDSIITTGNPEIATGFSFQRLNTGELNFRSYGSTYNLISSISVPINTWVHLAASRASGTLRLFIDGIVVSTGSMLSDLTDAAVLIGYRNASYNGYLNGYIDDLRITKGVARYTANFTPPTEPFPDL